MRCTGEVERLDALVALRAREDGALRLRLGQLLEVLGRGAVFELGFSSLGAYAVERCDRSVRWAEGARCLARRVEVLPALRRALATGRISWTMGEVLARVAAPADEASWLAFAEGRTVRQVQQHAEAIFAARAAGEVANARAETLQVPATAATATHGRHGELGGSSSGDGELGSWASDAGELCTLVCTVDREDAWLFEATRCLLEQLGELGMAAQSEALLAEALPTLQALLPKGAIDLDRLEECEQAHQRWAEKLRRWRFEAETARENDVLGQLASARGESVAPRLGPAMLAAVLGIEAIEHVSAVGLDQQVRALAGALARHELELSRLALMFHRADGWRRLGYATESQYARERLGLSRSSLAARRSLALRLERLSGVAAALGGGQIGVEAALQVVRIATPKTEAAWVERASRRTIKHLREEVAAALVAVRLAREVDCLPPENAEMAAFHALERAVLSGRFSPAPCSADARRPADTRATRPLVEPATESRGAWCVMLGSLASWLESALQMPAAAPHPVGCRARSFAGRVTLRLRMSRATFAWWRALEAQARRWLPDGMSWLRFLCVSFWQEWGHLLGTPVAYGHIYARDRFQCTSPVCSRRDITPHHIVFRSAGGSDDDDNITSPCTWCHLQGVHGGRIRASGSAEDIRWELGPRSAPTLIVQGRERLAA